VHGKDRDKGSGDVGDKAGNCKGERKKDKRSGGSVWEIRQVTASLTGQDGLTKKGGV
jgi:hypothetical protein